MNPKTKQLPLNTIFLSVQPFGCRHAFVLALFLAFSHSALLAQFDNFNDGDDSGWTRYDPFFDFGAPGTFSFPDGGYRLLGAISPNHETLGPSRLVSVRNDFVYSQFYTSVDLLDWDNTPNQSVAIVARVNELGLGTADGYTFSYDSLTGTSGAIYISRVTDEIVTGLVSAPIQLDVANEYRLVFTGNGSVLTGEVFDLANLVDPLASITAVDSTYASGVNGLGVINDGHTRGVADVTFDNYFATVPEPSTMVIGVMGGLILLCSGRRLSCTR